jgi:hypothetical protein
MKIIRSSICVRCSILILSIKTLRYSVVRCSIPHCTSVFINTSVKTPSRIITVISQRKYHPLKCYRSLQLVEPDNLASMLEIEPETFKIRS